jgi:hypothetical protein
MATTKELTERISKLEQQLQALGELEPNLQRMQEMLGTEADLRARTDTTLTSAVDALTRLTNTTAQVDDLSTRSTEITTRLTTVKDELDRVETSSRDLLTQQQTAFSQAETERSTAFSTLLASKSKELDQTLIDLRKDTVDQVAAIKEVVEGDLTAVEEAKVSVERILGIVGEEGLTGEYSKNAIRDRKSADFWRWITAGSIVLAVGATGWLAWAATKSTSTWRELVAKLVLAASFSALAGYSGQQSSEHRKAQRHSEEMASQLVALKPYLTGMTDQTKSDEILSEVAKKLFGQPSENEIVDVATKLDRGENPMIIGQLISLISEFVSKGKK